MRLATIFSAGFCLTAVCGGEVGVAQTTGPAPNCCGSSAGPRLLAEIHGRNGGESPGSSIYFTGYEGDVSEVYYPTVDTLATANMEFLIGDAANTFVDEEKLQSWTVTQPDPRSMRWQAITSNSGHGWQITKTIFADPYNSTLIQQTTLQALNGKTVADFNLYVLYKPYLHNSAADNSGSTVVARRQ